MAFLTLLSVIVWSALTSYSFIFRAEILAAKDVELAVAEKNFTEATVQFDKLKNDIKKSTMALEQRQIYLQQLLDADKSLSTSIAPQQKPLAAKAKKSLKKISYNSDLSGVYADHQTQLTNLRFSITRIEQQQQALAENMIERISTNIAYVDKTLKQSGINSK
jgi:hypothetical protein